MKRNFKIVIPAIMALVFLTGCSTSAASDEIFVHKGGGVFESQSEKGCIAPADREISKPGDNYYAYPANQRTYKFTGDQKTDDGTPFEVVSKDGQPMTVPGTVNFSLNTNCKVVQRFHDQIGNRYKAYMEDGTESEGWTQMLNIYFRPAIDATLDRVAKQYEWRQLYSDPAIKDEINKQVNVQVETLINQQFEGDEKFFDNYSALIQQPRADSKLTDAVKQAETAKAQAVATEAAARANASAAEAAANAQVAQKSAELKVATIQAQIQQAQIQSFGGAEAWAKSKAVDKGINPWQPSFGGSTIVEPPK